MKLNKKVTAVMAAAMMAASAFSVSAAGIGYVHTNALLQAHPKMEKAQLDMKQAAQKAQQQFQKQSAGKSDAEKQQIANNLQRELAQKERDEILSASQEDIRALAPYVQAVLDTGSLCVIGNEEKVKADKDLFGEVKNLFGA